MLATIRDLLDWRPSAASMVNGRLVGHGRYEGLTPFEVWLCENVDDVATETAGSVEWSIWFALCGRRIVLTDGFWYVSTFDTAAAALEAFTADERAYGEWAENDY